jgi:hypothetical protein
MLPMPAMRKQPRLSYLTENGNMKKACLLCFISCLALATSAQTDTSLINQLKTLDTYKNLKVDTLEPPNDPLTAKIRMLRAEQKGISINNFIQIKLADDAKDTTRNAAYRTQLKSELTSGHTARLIDNCVINLYRSMYTAPEVDELIRFYRTTAGRKFQEEQIFLILKSAKDAEQLIDEAKKKLAAAKSSDASQPGGH